MIYSIPERSGTRPFVMSTRRVRVPAASVPSRSRAVAAPGMLVVYGDHHLGRVLGRLESPAASRGWLVVLQLGSTADFACLRWVDPASVVQCRPNPGRFASWFFQASLPTPDALAHLAARGSLSERGMAELPSGPATAPGRQPPAG